jgi:hypothetical protein
MNVTKLPTAATSYYTVQKTGRFFMVSLVTPCIGRNLKTHLYRFTDRAAAIQHGEATAARMQRPFKVRKVRKGGEV